MQVSFNFKKEETHLVQEVRSYMHPMKKKKEGLTLYKYARLV